jgi:hypothetical protein
MESSNAPENDRLRARAGFGDPAILPIWQVTLPIWQSVELKSGSADLAYPEFISLHSNRKN